MLIGLWHTGSGVGDQLFCYLSARIAAQRLGVPFGMVGSFKGKDFLPVDKGVEPYVSYRIELPAGKIHIEKDFPLYEGKFNYDPEFWFIHDNTIVDGCLCQDERYWSGFPIAEWLKTEPLYMADDVCVINFRGGEFAAIPELFLPKSYWDEGVRVMKERGFSKFEVHTDDPHTASLFFPDYPITHNVGLNWRSVRYAKGAIIANSAFGIIPRWLAHREGGATTVAPRYWARRNSKEWSLPQNYYSDFLYI